MTVSEALEIPELNIDVTDIVEDCFYYKMFLLQRISLEQGLKAEDRIKHKYSKEQLEKALATADRMIDNLDRYGVACVSMM